MEQPTATTGLPRVPRESYPDLEQVFGDILTNAMRFCEADSGCLFLRDTAGFEAICIHGATPAYSEYLRRVPLRSGPGTLIEWLAAQPKTLHLPDLVAETAYRQREPDWVAAVELEGARTALLVPMLHREVVIGAVTLYRRERRPFTDEHVARAQIFAEQAVIAVENVRLFQELQLRNHELATAREQQIATAEILRVISGSPSDALPVFETIVHNAVALCGSLFANVFRYDGELLHYVASRNTGPSYVELLQMKYPMRPDISQISGRVILSKSVVSFEDIRTDPNYDQRFPKAMGWRRVLGVPMLREGKPIGVIVVGWVESGPVPKEQEELLRTFADQAVIAVENARLFDELQSKSRQLELANTYKSRFLSAASHDLRQPLHALNLFVAQLRTELDPTERDHLVARIEAAVNAINELINALLDMSRLDAGKLELNITEFPVEKLLRRMETTFAEAAREKGLRLSVVSSNTWVRSDFILLERILLNLVSNAVRYTERGGIVIGCRRRGETVRLEVCDSGIGIAEDQQQNIFDEFYRLAAADRERQYGLGLGLAIVDRLGSLLDHPIELKSHPGKGSRFMVSVPVVPERLGQAEVPVSSETIADTMDGKLIVVIDDDALVLDGMRGLLRSWGCEVETAVSDTAALARLEEIGQHPDLIISDYHLPNGKTGFEAIECLRNTMGDAIPAFLISGDTAPERIREARASGYYLLHKPVHPAKLRALVQQLLSVSPATA
ncbi:MAG: NahK/ErcS family hybrid sensor histidine kinase/response regulator [Sulfuricaulis sp.]|uniref:NahK/ErcS family hybrid sensor histidine kinase/response regulator n=1 Tax=Sulfuricaulis sp. TaxID=2003553 RepID=UPI0034A3031C